MKKNWRFLLLIVSIVCFVFTSCTLNEKTPKNGNTDEQVIKEQAPSYKYSIGDRGKVFKFESKSLLRYEDLEEYFSIYGSLDANNKAFSMVVDDQIREFTLEEKNMTLSGKKICEYEIRDNELFVNPEQFLNYLGSKVYNNSSDIKSEEKIAPKYKKHSYVLAWDLYGNKDSQKFSSTIDVVLPKWVSLKDKSGAITTNFRAEYAKNAKNQGIELWVMVSSFDPDITGASIRDSVARKKLTTSITEYAVKNKVQGINIDFENMYLKDSDAFVQFIAELGALMRAQNKILSVCVTVPGGSDNWSKVYDRERIAENCDFLTLMAYDQYWAASQEPGPVAGYAWVKKHVENMVKTIPSEKIILGVPLYTRMWHETFSDKEPNKILVRSRSVFLETPKRVIEELQPLKVWDETNRQNFYVYYDNSKKEMVKFWHENEITIAEKSELAVANRLSGIACWSLGFVESDEIWQKLSTIKKEMEK